MKLKKLMSLGLALVMAAALAAPALAADITAGGSEQTTNFSGDGNTKVPTVRISTVTASNVIFNPYKLKAKMGTAAADTNEGKLVDSETDAAKYEIVTDQIISKAMVVNNQTDVPLRVGVVLGVEPKNSDTSTTAETAKVVKSAPAASVLAKQVYVYADFAVFDGTAAQLKDRPEAWLTSQRLVGDTAIMETANNTTTWNGTSGGKLEVKSGAGGIYMPTPTTKADGDPREQNNLFIKLGGAATATPTNVWSTSDTVDVHIALKFVPMGSAPLYKLYMATYTAPSTAGADPTYAAGARIGTTAETTNVPTLTIPYQNGNINTSITTPIAGAPLWTSAAKEKQVDGNIEAGYVITIHPPVGSDGKATHSIKSVTFYDANNVKLTAPKAVSTNTKDKTAPWTFTMPAQSMVVDIEMETIS